MKKTEFDADGLPIGHYDTDIHGKNIPKNAVKVTDKKYQDMIENQGNRKRNSDTGKIVAIISPLDLSREERKSEIRDAYNVALNQPVIVDGIEYHGGYDSVTKLDGAKRLVELAGGGTITLYDTNNVGHDLSLADAKTVIITIGVQVQTLFAKKQGLMVNIDNAADQAALDVIVW